MNPKLQNENELSVKYILNELDPSEETMIEQAMLDDQNLLIEVESMRRTLKKCEELPYYSAPEMVLDQVMEDVASYHSSKSTVVRLKSFRNFSYAAAATVLIAGGTAWYVQGGALTSGQPGVGIMAETHLNAELNDSNHAPWIDKRDILHVSSVGSAGTILPDTAISRLRPIEEQSNGRSAVRQIQLTGSQN